MLRFWVTIVLNKIDVGRIVKIRGAFSEGSAVSRVIHEVSLIGMPADVNSPESRGYYLGNGIAIVMPPERFRDSIKKIDYRIYYFPEPVSWGNSVNVHLIVYLVSTSRSHVRALRRICSVAREKTDANVYSRDLSESEVCHFLASDNQALKETGLWEGKIIRTETTNPFTAFDELNRQRYSLLEDSSFVLRPVRIKDGIWLTVLDSQKYNKTQLLVAACPEEHFALFAVTAGRGAERNSLLHALSIAASYEQEWLWGDNCSGFEERLSEIAIDFDCDGDISGKDNERWCEFETQIKIPHGLHSRPASVLVKIAKLFCSDVMLRKKGMNYSDSVNAKNFMSLLTLGVREGDLIVVRCSGDDMKEALDAIKTGFLQELTQQCYKNIMLVRQRKLLSD